jgi:hypothetical protein
MKTHKTTKSEVEVTFKFKELTLFHRSTRGAVMYKGN